VRSIADKTAGAVLIVCIGIDVTVTIFFYFLTVGNGQYSLIRWIAFLFLILAEAVGTAKAVMAKRTIIGFAHISVSILHIAAVFIISILFVQLFPRQISSYVLLNILGWAVMLVFDTGIYFFNNLAAEENKKLAYSMDLMNDCYAKAHSIGMTHSDSVYSKELCKISDMIKYSDNTVMTGMENILSEKLAELENALSVDNHEVIMQTIEEAVNIIQTHAVRIKSMKRGRF